MPGIILPFETCTSLPTSPTGVAPCQTAHQTYTALHTHHIDSQMLSCGLYAVNCLQSHQKGQLKLDMTLNGQLDKAVTRVQCLTLYTVTCHTTLSHNFMTVDIDTHIRNECGCSFQLQMEAERERQCILTLRVRSDQRD